MRFSIILAASLLTACASQPDQAHYSPTPALPVIGADGLAHCPSNDIICDNSAYRMNHGIIEQRYNAKMVAIDIDSARKRLIAAKEAYQQTPDATHSVAVDEAQARLNTLIAKRGY